MPAIDWNTLQEQSRLDAIRKIANESRIDAIRKTVSEAFQELYEHKYDATNETFWPVVGIPWIGQKLLSNDDTAEWGVALLESSTHSEGVKSSQAMAADMVIGQVAGAYSGAEPCEDKLIFVRRLRDSIPYPSSAFLDFAKEAIELEESAKSTLINTLRQRVLNFHSDPDCLAFIPRRELEYLRKHSSTHSRFADVWHEPFRRAMIHVHDSIAYELLRRIDRRSYLDLLEMLPVGDAVYDLVQEASKTATFSDLCGLVLDAQPAFDSDGKWHNDKRVVFYVLSELSSRLLEHISPDGTLLGGFGLGLSEILSALKSRADAIPLGYAWLQRLLVIGHGYRRRTPHIHEINITLALIEISDALALILPPHATPLEWIADELDVWRCDRVYTLLAIELSRTTVDDRRVIDFIEKVLLQDLVLTTNLQRLLERPGFERQVISYAISRIPDIPSWFRTLWKKTYWQRNRTRGHRRTGYQLPKIAQVIILWTLCVLDRLEPSAARGLWLELESATRESYFTDATSVFNDLWVSILEFLGVTWQKTFSNDPSKGSPGALDDFVTHWRGVDRNFAFLTVTLRRNNVSPLRLAAAGITADLLRLIVEDSKVGSRSLLTPEQSKAILELADEILTTQ